MSEPARSEQACPVCSQHTLALDRPPEIDVMGVQAYSDMLGMGDLENEGVVGIVCLTCGTHWHDKEAFDRGEPDPDSASDAPADFDFGDGGGDGSDDDAGGDGGE
jgi:hypothetical protein